MSWKRQVQLLDLEDASVEVCCRHCGRSAFHSGAAVAAAAGGRQLYLDEAESNLRCAAAWCGGPVVVAIPMADRGATFAGGMS